MRDACANGSLESSPIAENSHAVLRRRKKYCYGRLWRDPDLPENAKEFRLSGRCRRDMLATRFSHRSPRRTARLSSVDPKTAILLDRLLPGRRAASSRVDHLID